MVEWIKYRAIVIGSSAGGHDALVKIFLRLPKDFPLPIIIAQHIAPVGDADIFGIFNNYCALKVKEADEKEKIEQGHVYFAPPGYHLLIESDHTFSFSVDGKVQYSRPSIDVLFESAADAYGAELVGVILTGANHDGARGLEAVKEGGGLTMVEDPASAASPIMPQAAIDRVQVDHVADIDTLAGIISKIAGP